MEISPTSNELAWIQPLPRRLPEPLECHEGIIDRVDLSPQASGEPVPQNVDLPEVAFQPHKLPAAFRGQLPLPRKLDLHSLEAGPRVARDARRLEGTPAVELTGKLRGFRNTTGMSETSYGTNNQCANFVSTFAHRLGLKGHFLVVPDLERALQKQGWQRVSAAEARPGDVWMSDSHTELVTGRERGRPRLTGSNNGGNSYQTISGHTQASGRFYTRPIWRDQH
ncbi:hypothetical protein ABS71_01850 [bacterium SCN 62-11]|nr:hypothetical protein [Candidatus Eremiobacteraeota bacterium]ODT78496.1 MAG: hypothetical protein ABS71_01850 [bacterium SCN 62-11]